MNYDFTSGPITKNLLIFSVPLMIGNILQQVYNVADTLIVGKYLGEHALAAVGTAYTLMTFLTSVFIGLCMGSGAYFSMQYGKRDEQKLKTGMFVSFLAIGGLTLLINVAVFVLLNPIMQLLQIPPEVRQAFSSYIKVIFMGIIAVFLYNYFANLLRSLGNSLMPLVFLGISSVLNIGLDIWMVLELQLGVSGTAYATVISQYISALGIIIYYILRCQHLHLHREHLHFDKTIWKEISSLSLLTCLQQSIMNFGILMVQGLVNSFGTAVMAAFTTAVKIDTLAYSPVQDFGNAFSTFVAQNYGANKKERIQKGIRSAMVTVFIFCLGISTLIFVCADKFIGLFVQNEEIEIIRIGAGYLRIEGSFYLGIGILFLLYGLYRAVNRPWFSVLLTTISLGTRVILAYVLSAIPPIGVTGIWISIPIGWLLADITGILYWHRKYIKR